MNWAKIDPDNPPEPGRMLVTDGRGAWALNEVRKTAEGNIIAIADNGTVIFSATHYTYIGELPK